MELDVRWAFIKKALFVREQFSEGRGSGRSCLCPRIPIDALFLVGATEDSLTGFLIAETEGRLKETVIRGILGKLLNTLLQPDLTVIPNQVLSLMRQLRKRAELHRVCGGVHGYFPILIYRRQPTIAYTDPFRVKAA